jgi:hypothetical protein
MLDAKLIMCEDQDCPNAGSVASDDIIDVGAYEDALGEEEHIRLRVEVAVDAGAGTSLLVEAAHDTVAPVDASSIVFASSDVVLAADLLKGKVLIDAGLPVEHGRIIGLYLTGDGDVSTCLINAYLYVR